MNILYRIIISIIFIGVFVMVFPVEASNDLSVDFGKYDSRPFFNIVNMAPGEEISKSFTVYNDDRFKKNIFIKGKVRYETGNLSTVLDILIKQNNKPIYGFKTLRAFFLGSASHELPLFPIQARSKNSYQITVRFQHRAGNIFQNKRVSFDIQIEDSKKR